ncbi:MAG: hypothetical protein L6R41_001723 [Letrouitia leprolyta]|nr:MAG: hypothetical protein L6R41_001723 [Letrouitia leprolyta]
MAAAPPAETAKPRSSDTSSASLSSPPSPHSPTAQHPITYPRLPLPLQDGGGDNEVGGDKATVTAKNPALKQRKPRKKKESGEGNNDNKPPTLVNGEKAPPKARKPRAPRNSSATATIKKEQKLAFATASNPAKPHAIAPNQITDHPGSPHLLQNSGVPVASPHLPIGKVDEAIPTSRNPMHYAIPSPPRPASGQNYDPIRSATIEPRNVQPPMQQVTLHARTSASTPPRPAGHPSISPSIASLLEPHSATSSYNAMLKRHNELPVSSPPDAKRPRQTPPANMSETAHPTPQEAHVPIPQPQLANKTTASAMDVDVDRPAPKITSKQAGGTKKPSGQSSSSHSPKPSARKDAALPPLPPGNGLLSSAMLGGGQDSKGPERTAPTVILHVPLNGDSNKYVNFARLAEEQYGFDALHPRLAAQRERLARVAAAGAALEHAHKTGSGRSADEMSVDLSDGEPDADNSNVEMGGVNGTKDVKQSEAEASEQAGVKRRKKRTMKEDMYDKDDPFVDDSELAFEEQAAATKDGFFVYSGPLVPEGEKANVER